MIYLMYLLLFFCYLAEAIISEGTHRKLNDQSSVIFSLNKYNISNPNGESLESLYTVSPNSTITIFVDNIPENVHFIVVQAHSYLFSVTLSYDTIPSLNNSITGTNTGLVKMRETNDLSLYLIYNNSSKDVEVLFAVQAYGADAPIPGGCNMEFQLEISPFLKTTYSEDITEVDFAPAAPPESGLPDSFFYSNNECNIKPSPVEHFMYHQYFPEGDFSNKTYFKTIKSLMTKSRIQKNGVLVRNKLSLSPLRRIFASYPGTGNAFVVVSHFGNRTAVYVPSFTYACNYLDDESCFISANVFIKILSTVVFLMGFLTCFFGNIFLRISIFLFGFLLSSNLIYTFFSLIFSIELSLPTTISSGLFFSILIMLSKMVFKFPIVSSIFASLCFGFLFVSVIFYAITDYCEFLVSDLNFWCVFIAVVISFFLKSLVFQSQLNIIACAFIGSYVAVAVIDYYIGSNIRFIFMNSVKRAVNDKFKWAIIGPPFQLYDILLTVAWVLLFCAGFSFQKFLRKYFFKTTAFSHGFEGNENTPLLA